MTRCCLCPPWLTPLQMGGGGLVPLSPAVCCRPCVPGRLPGCDCAACAPPGSLPCRWVVGTWCPCPRQSVTAHVSQEGCQGVTVLSVPPLAHSPADGWWGPGALVPGSLLPPMCPRKTARPGERGRCSGVGRVAPSGGVHRMPPLLRPCLQSAPV